MAATYSTLSLTGIGFSVEVIDLDFQIQANEHGKAEITGYIKEAVSIMNLKSMYGTNITLSDDETVLFSGPLVQVDISETGGFQTVHLVALTASSILDTKPRSRSFQDVTLTYSDVVNMVLNETAQASAICTVGDDKAIGKPLIQYQETDWQFIRRLCSHFNTSLLPEHVSGRPYLWFGAPDKNTTAQIISSEYKVLVSQKYYDMGGKHSGLSKQHFLYYEVNDTQDFAIGTSVSFYGKTNYVCSKRGTLQNGELIYTYQLGTKALMSERCYYNKKITGLSLTGTVLETAGETVKLHLDIDSAQDAATAYPYQWVPTTGNLMYLMPKIGTKAALLLCNEDERNAKATETVRENGSGYAGFSDYNNRYLTTEHQKQMYLTGQGMGFVGTSGMTIPLRVSLDDLNYMVFESHKELHVIAQGNITIEAPNVSLRTPVEIFVMQTSQYSDAFLSAIFPRGTAPQNPPTGSGEASLSLAYRFDILGSSGVLQGYEYIAYEPFQDAPEKGDYSLLESIFKAVIAVAIIAVVTVALVAATVITAGAAIAIVAGACIVAGCVVYADHQSGNNSSFETYLIASLVGAIIGGCIYALGALTLKALPLATKGITALGYANGIPLLVLKADIIAKGMAMSAIALNSVRMMNWGLSNFFGENNYLVDVFFEPGTPEHAEATSVYRNIATMSNYLNIAYVGVTAAGAVVTWAESTQMNWNDKAKDPKVGDTANAIDERYPGKVQDVERIIYDENNRPITDFDIELDNSIIQVKTGSGKGATTQAITTASVTDKEVIVYLPDKNPGSAVCKSCERAGFTVITSLEKLLEYLGFR